MTEPADGTALPIGTEHPLAEAALVQPLPDDRRDVLSPRGQRRRVIDLPGSQGRDLVVDRHDEGQILRVVVNDEYRPGRLVEARDYPMEVDQRGPAPHSNPEPAIVAMLRVVAAVA